MCDDGKFEKEQSSTDNLDTVQSSENGVFECDKQSTSLDKIENTDCARCDDSAQGDTCNTFSEVDDDIEYDDNDIVMEDAPVKKKRMKGKIPTQKLVLFAIYLALTILFQYIGSYIKIGTASICIVLIPIVLGGVTLGVLAGALLGLGFAIVTIVATLMGGGLGLVLLEASPALLILTLLGKGILCGFIPALLYKVIAKKNMFAGCIVASITAPIINTGIFILGGLTMSGTISSLLATDPSTSSMTPIYFLVVVVAGVNFLIELGINIVASPAIYGLNKIYLKRFAR